MYIVVRGSSNRIGYENVNILYYYITSHICMDWDWIDIGINLFLLIELYIKIYIHMYIYLYIYIYYLLVG